MSLRMKGHTRKVVEAAIENLDFEIGRLRKVRDFAARRLDDMNRQLDSMITERDQLQADIDYDNHWDLPVPALPGVSPHLHRLVERILGYKGGDSK